MIPKPVLYVEDDRDDAFFVQLYFAKVQVSNPLIILSRADLAMAYLSGTGEYASRNEHPLPCLVLLDLNLAGTSGLDLLKWIRAQHAQPCLCTLPVLMLTSSKKNDDIHAAYLLGANGYLQKLSSSEKMLMMAKAVKDFWLTVNCGAAFAMASALAPNR